MIQETSSGAKRKLDIMGDALKSQSQDGMGEGENKSTINNFERDCWEGDKIR